MADQNIARPGVRFLSKVGGFTMLDNATGQVVFTGEFLTSASLEITSTSNSVRGGAGNGLLMQTYSDRNVAVTLTIREFDLAYIAAAEGSLIDYIDTSNFVIEQVFNVDATGKATLTPIPVGPVSIKLPNGSRVNATADTAGVVDLTAYNVPNTCVNATFAYAAKGRQISILSSTAPYLGRLILHGDLMDNAVGKIGMVEIEIPSFQMSDNITITMNNDGTTSDTVITGNALSVAGNSCTAGSVYAYVREIIDNMAPMLITYIQSTPNPVELRLTPTPGTVQLTTKGYYGPMYSPQNVSGQTYTSAAPATATVSATGLKLLAPLCSNAYRKIS